MKETLREIFDKYFDGNPVQYVNKKAIEDFTSRKTEMINKGVDKHLIEIIQEIFCDGYLQGFLLGITVSKEVSQLKEVQDVIQE